MIYKTGRPKGYAARKPQKGTHKNGRAERMEQAMNGPGEGNGKEKSLLEKREAREGSDQKEKEKTLPICKENPPNDTEGIPKEKRPGPDWKGPIGRRTLTGRPRKFKTPQELLDKAAEYIEALCDEDGWLTQPITISGMCNYIGTYRQRLFEYENGSLEGLKDGNGDDEGFRDAIKRMKSICEEYAENHMFTARNPAGAIFALKNYGWRDIQTVETVSTEIHTIDPETRQILQDYMNQLAQAQLRQVIDVTPVPARIPELVKVRTY